MKEQKQEIIRIVEDQRLQGRTITEILRDLHIKRPTYYSWLKPKNKTPQRRAIELTPEEKHAIEKAKDEYPHLRHRQIQGILQNSGIYLS